MHAHPFDLLHVQITDPTGRQLFNPQWLLVFGQSRRQLSLQEAYQAYTDRFSLEHGIRFGKQHVMMAQFQTPQVTQEETWVHFPWLAMCSCGWSVY